MFDDNGFVKAWPPGGSLERVPVRAGPVHASVEWGREVENATELTQNWTQQLQQLQPRRKKAK